MPAVTSLPGAASSGFGSPPAEGPWEVLGERDELRQRVGLLGPLRLAEADLGPRLGLEHLLRGVAGDADDRNGGAAGRDRRERPLLGLSEHDGARPDGGGRRRLCDGLAPARTITTLSRMRVSSRPSTAGSVSVTGPAVWPLSGGSPASTAASACVAPRSRLASGRARCR